MARKKLKFFNAMLCEHVVAGANNKQTLVNVFSGDIVVASIPSKLFLGLYIELSPDTPGDLEIVLKLNRKVHARVTTKILDNAKKHSVKTLSIPVIEVGVDRDVTITVSGSAEGYVSTTFIKKRIYKGTITSPTISF